MSQQVTNVQPPSRKQFASITKVKNLQELWDHPGLKTRMEAILPRHLNADRLLRTLINCSLKTPGLAKVDPMSMLGVAMTLAYLGLEPNTPLQQVHLIPFDVRKYNRQTKEREYVRTDANLIIGYQGYIELVARGERVKDIDCQVIWAGDEWENERGTAKHFRHVEKFLPRKPEQEPDFAYMHARLASGGEHVELLTAADVHHTRNLSQGYRTAVDARDEAIKKGWRPPASYTEAPWIKFPVPMWRKTALRAGQKMLPKSAELATAISLDEAGDEGRVRFSQIIEAEAVSEGVWEVSPDEVEPDEKPEPTEATKTQVQGATVSNAEPQPDAKNEAAGQPATSRPSTRKAPAKQAASAEQTGPAKDDGVPWDRWEDHGQSGSGPARPSVEPSQTSAPANHGGDGAGTSPGATATDSQVAAPGASTFDAWLSDQHSVPVTEEPDDDPVQFVQHLHEHIEMFPDARERILQENADAIDAVRAHGNPQAIFMLDQLPTGAAEEKADEEAPPGAIVIELRTDRGKPMEQAYKTAFDAEVPNLVPANFFDFIELNRANMARLRGSYIALLVKGLELRAKAIGVIIPDEMRQALLKPNAPPAAPAPAAAAQGASEERQDLTIVRNRVADINSCNTLADLQALNRGPVLSGFADRMKREGKTALLEMVQSAYKRREAELRGPPS